MGDVLDIETGQPIRTPVFWRAMVGMDGSPESKRALRQAAAISVPADALVLVDVISSNGTAQPPAAVRRLAMEELEDAAGCVVGGRAVLARLRSGKTAEVLLEEAADADLLAVGAPREGHAGSVVNALTARTRCPLLIARGDRGLPVLVAVGDTLAARDLAAAVAVRTGAQLTALADPAADLLVVPADMLASAWGRATASLLVVPAGS